MTFCSFLVIPDSCVVSPSLAIARLRVKCLLGSAQLMNSLLTGQSVSRNENSQTHEASEVCRRCSCAGSLFSLLFAKQSLSLCSSFCCSSCAIPVWRAFLKPGLSLAWCRLPVLVPHCLGLRFRLFLKGFRFYTTPTKLAPVMKDCILVTLAPSKRLLLVRLLYYLI